MKQNKEMELQAYAAVAAGEIEIDSEGRIWRIAKRGWDRWNQTTRLNKCKRVRAENRVGEYLQIRVMLNKRRAQPLAHRIVFIHFHGLIPDGLTVNHKNGIKNDNSPDNLELATYSEQQIHARQVLKHGRLNQNGEKNCMAKLTEQKVSEIRTRRARGEKLASIAADYGVQFQAISKIALMHRWADSG